MTKKSKHSREKWRKTRTFNHHKYRLHKVYGNKTEAKGHKSKTHMSRIVTAKKEKKYGSKYGKAAEYIGPQRKIKASRKTLSAY